VVVVGSVAFLAAWVSGGSRFNYVGLQIGFAFYIVAFEGFGAPTQLAPARDRVVGILFALTVMWFVFDQIWPVRTVTAMRRVLASLLRSGATLLLVVYSAKQRDQVQREMDGVGDRVGKNISALRTMSEAVEYELGAGASVNTPETQSRVTKTCRPWPRSPAGRSPRLRPLLAICHSQPIHAREVDHVTMFGR
jgi:multidrug resistance protein MdtO